MALQTNIDTRKKEIQTKAIQKKINQFYDILGFEKSKRIKEDGIFGKQTKSAVIKVQRFLKRMKLYKGRIDGIWGKMTENAYNDFMKKYKKELPFSVEMKFDEFYFMCGKRLWIFLKELDSSIEKHYNINKEYVHEYILRNKDRAKKLYKKAISVLKKSNKNINKDLVGQVVLSSIAAEAIFHIKAEILLSIAMSETGIRNVFGKNGQGVMQITRNSSVSYLRGYWLEKANELIANSTIPEDSKLPIPMKKPGKEVIKERIKYSEIYTITNNVFASAETLLLKMAERRMQFADLRDKENLRFLAMSYNGHPDYMKGYGKRFINNYIKFA